MWEGKDAGKRQRKKGEEITKKKKQEKGNELARTVRMRTKESHLTGKRKQPSQEGKKAK